MSGYVNMMLLIDVTRGKWGHSQGQMLFQNNVNGYTRSLLGKSVGHHTMLKSVSPVYPASAAAADLDS